MIARTSKHSIVVTPAGDVSQHAAVRQHVVTTDQPENAGGSDAGPSPLELMSVSLASCVALYVQRFCSEQQLPTEGLTIQVNPIWRKDPGRIGRFDVTVLLPDGIPVEHRAAIEEVARSCPVHATLAHVPEITMQVEELAAASAP